MGLGAGAKGLESGKQLGKVGKREERLENDPQAETEMSAQTSYIDSDSLFSSAMFSLPTSSPFLHF